MFFIVLFLIFIVVFSIIRFSQTSNKVKDNNTNVDVKNSNEIGMYFMNLYDITYKKRHEIENSDFLLDYYNVLGCASQGRIDEVKAIISEYKNKPLGKIFQKYSPQILKMAKIGKEVEDKPIGYDLRNGESTGEYYDRKVSNRPAFMQEFIFFKNLKIENEI